MAEAPIRVLTRFLSSRPASATDAELLQRYANNRDEAAFAELVRRHGPMVLGTAARVLGSDPAAEDAFQVAFVALARRAGAIRGSSVAGWLHRTVMRAAVRLRSRIAPLPHTIERECGDQADPFAQACWQEVRQALDREIDALPTRLRAPLVLCYLEALSRDQAAVRLGVSLRTLERRLSNGRSLLQSRLRRRGIASVGLAAMAAGGVSRPVSASLIDSVVHSARATRTVSAFALTRLLAASVLIASVTIVTGLVVLQPAPAGDPPVKAPPSLPVAKKSPANESPDLPLPAGAIRRFGSLAWRHNGGIYQSVLSADGKTLATVSQDSLFVWDTPTGKLRHVNRSMDLIPLFEPGNVALAPDGSWLAYTASSKAAVRVIDVATGKDLLAIERSEKAARNDQFRSVWAAPDGKRLLVCNEKVLTSFDSATGKKLNALDLPGRVIALSPDGKLLAVHNQEKPSDGYICDAATGKEIARLDGDLNGPGNGWSIRVAFSSDGMRLATISILADEVRMWDTKTGKLERKYQQEKSTTRFDDPGLSAVAFSVDSKTLYAGGLSTSGVRRWEVATAKELPRLRNSFGPVASLLPSPMGDVLFDCGGDSVIRRWNVSTGKELPSPLGHAERVALAQSPDGRLIVTSDLSSQLRVWEAGSGRLLQTIPLSGDYSGPPFAFSSDGKTFACCVRPAGIRLFDTSDWKQGKELNLAAKSDRAIHGLAFESNGGGLFAGGRDEVVLWDFKTNQVRWTISEQIVAMAHSPDGKHLAVSVAEGISIRSATNGSESFLISVKPDPETDLAFPIRTDALAYSPDGYLLAATRWDTGDVYVWEAATGKEVYRLVGHGRPEQTRIKETSLAFSRDGRWLATGHGDNTARIWEMATGKEAFRLNGLGSRVSEVQFGRDGHTLLSSAGVDVLLWDLLRVTDARTDLKALWTDLGSDDAGVAYRASTALAARKDETVKFLSEKLNPVQPVDAERVAKWVADLDSVRFATREAATKALTELGGAARPALEAGLSKKPSAEGNARIETMLAALRKPLSGAEAREVRSIQILQWIGTPDANEQLKGLATGAPGARLTEQAKRTLRVRGE